MFQLSKGSLRVYFINKTLGILFCFMLTKTVNLENARRTKCVRSNSANNANEKHSEQYGRHDTLQSHFVRWRNSAHLLEI